MSHRDTVGRRDLIEKHRRGHTLNIHIILDTQRHIVVTAVDGHRRILEVMPPRSRIRLDDGMLQRTDLGITHDLDIAIHRDDLGIGHEKVADLVGMDDVIVHVIVGVGGVERQRVVLRQQRNEFRFSLRRSGTGKVHPVRRHIPFRLVQRAIETVQREIQVTPVVQVFVTRFLSVQIHQ